MRVFFLSGDFKDISVTRLLFGRVVSKEVFLFWREFFLNAKICKKEIKRKFFFECSTIFQNLTNFSKIFIFSILAFDPQIAYCVKNFCVPCAREGGFMGLNLGYCSGAFNNCPTQGIGSELAAIDIEIPKGPMGVGYICPDELQDGFSQNGFMAGIEMGYDFKVSGKPGKGWMLGYFLNGSLSTTIGKFSFPGSYYYPVEDEDTVPTQVNFEEKLLVKNKGFLSTGLRFGPLVQRAFFYAKSGFMMTRTGISLERSSLTRLVVPSRVYWFKGVVLGVGADFQVSSVFVMGIDITANICGRKKATVAFSDLGGAIFVNLRPVYTQVLLTLKYKFPLRARLNKPSSVSSVYRPSW
ncbi:hypothetical protein [Holospora undulata]|uniref:Outer membrane protein beta-barrel domain-containing protein n=1 Tax=Holospora undulata HU1 TaxID=1321371 RepID=A0A061JHQ8_9PROT|nr:hypothetical protein [Holospora undulata]ETZ04918.1 hypothetical protein K737_300662 [Holospora undulata HU1]